MNRLDILSVGPGIIPKDLYPFESVNFQSRIGIDEQCTSLEMLKFDMEKTSSRCGEVNVHYKLGKYPQVNGR